MDGLPNIDPSGKRHLGTDYRAIQADIYTLVHRGLQYKQLLDRRNNRYILQVDDIETLVLSSSVD